MPFRHALLAVLAALALLAPVSARADERILSYDSQLAVQKDGMLLVTETITVRAEGTNIRRGIYRDIPTRYKDRFGNAMRVDLEVLGVERDGRPEPWFIERKRNGLRINTGNDDFLPVPATYAYTIRYRSNRQLGFFADHDELYWNVTGVGWAFPIDAVTATVTLPDPVPTADLRLDAYTGTQGAKGQDAIATAPQPGVATFRVTRPLAQGENLTIAVGWPKGLVAAPTAAQKTRWFLRDNGGVLVGLVSFLLLGAFYWLRWVAVGRDPPPMSVFPRYEPPAGFSPGELRMLKRLSNDNLCFTSDIVDMAVRGFLTIHREGDKDWRLVRVPGSSLDSLALAQRPLAAKLFKESDEIELENTNASRVQAVMSAHAGEMAKRLKPRYFITNASTLILGLVFSLVMGLVALLVARNNGLVLLIVIGVLTLALHITFGILLKAPTHEGRQLLDAIDGLKMYLGVAERDELKSVRGPQPDVAPGRASATPPPPLDAKRYEQLLPYAMALDVEEAWTRRFTIAVGAAAVAAATPSWYVGSGGRPMSFASLGSSLGSSLNSTISSASTPPGSSSGGGGGGFSGGGGGGGGGGGR